MSTPFFSFLKKSNFLIDKPSFLWYYIQSNLRPDILYVIFCAFITFSWNKLHERLKSISNNSTILHCGRNISALPKIPSLAAYKRAWRSYMGYVKRSQRGGLEKFAVASFCKGFKSLATLDVFAYLTKQKIIPSKTFSKKFANLKTK